VIVVLTIARPYFWISLGLLYNSAEFGAATILCYNSSTIHTPQSENYKRRLERRSHFTPCKPQR
jgi:hypothetical protein